MDTDVYTLLSDISQLLKVNLWCILKKQQHSVRSVVASTYLLRDYLGIFHAVRLSGVKHQSG